MSVRLVIGEKLQRYKVNETELSALVNLCYLSARNKYRVEREEKAGKGFVNFTFWRK